MHVEQAYPVAPRTLYAVLTDAAFLAARGERFGGAGAPSVGATGGRTVVRTPRALPLDAVPGALRKFAGDGTLEQVDEWTEVTDTAVRGTWRAEVGTVPMQLDGTHDITGHPESCVYVVTARVKVRIPVVGRVAEKSVDEHLGTLVAKELDFAADWLAR